MEVVDGMHAGQSRGGLVPCREMLGQFPSVR